MVSTRFDNFITLRAPMVFSWLFHASSWTTVGVEVRSREEVSRNHHMQKVLIKMFYSLVRSLASNTRSKFTEISVGVYGRTQRHNQASTSRKTVIVASSTASTGMEELVALLPFPVR